MSMIPAHFKLPFAPAAADEAIVQCGGARFTVLTPRLLRLEYQPTGQFIDRASQAFWFRAQPVPPFTTRREGDRVEIDTGALVLHYDGGAAEGFSPDNLAIAINATGATWHPGETDTD
ncbi:MAG: hypothetical protein JW910_08290, partial [Anaerolineae bacterium]|nr:hypothetical protein [Anaerolineae bacterium]